MSTPKYLIQLPTRGATYITQFLIARTTTPGCTLLRACTKGLGAYLVSKSRPTPETEKTWDTFLHSPGKKNTSETCRPADVNLTALRDLRLLYDAVTADNFRVGKCGIPLLPLMFLNTWPHSRRQRPVRNRRSSAVETRGVTVCFLHWWKQSSSFISSSGSRKQDLKIQAPFCLHPLSIEEALNDEEKVVNHATIQ